MENELKTLRIKTGFTQQKASDFFGISLRSYKSYENDPAKKDTMKYKYMVEKLMENSLIDEEHGVLPIDTIKSIVREVFEEYEVAYCYLFGSYARGKANNHSDVDMLISTNVSGIKYYGMVEKLRSKLHKKVDLLNVNQLENNIELLNEILKDGIKVYG